MCGRFTLTTPDYKTLLTTFAAEMKPQDAALYRPRFNIAPSDRHWIIAKLEGKRRIVPALWGFQRRDLLINARLETVTQKPTFQEAFQNRRCIIPADGFYEWSGTKGRKIPHWFRTPTGDLLPLAGLFEIEPELRFTILTTQADEVVAPIHQRMPVIVPLDGIDGWLTESRFTTGGVLPLESRRVSPYVNSAQHDDPGCLTADPGASFRG